MSWIFTYAVSTICAQDEMEGIAEEEEEEEEEVGGCDEDGCGSWG